MNYIMSKHRRRLKTPGRQPLRQRKPAHNCRSCAEICPILRWSTRPSAPRTTVKGSPPVRLPSERARSVPPIPARPNGKSRGSRCRNERTAEGWSRAVHSYNHSNKYVLAVNKRANLYAMSATG